MAGAARPHRPERTWTPSRPMGPRQAVRRRLPSPSSAADAPPAWGREHPGIRVDRRAQSLGPGRCAAVQFAVQLLQFGCATVRQSPLRLGATFWTRSRPSHFSGLWAASRPPRWTAAVTTFCAAEPPGFAPTSTPPSMPRPEADQQPPRKPGLGSRHPTQVVNWAPRPGGSAAECSGCEKLFPPPAAAGRPSRKLSQLEIRLSSQSSPAHPPWAT